MILDIDLVSNHWSFCVWDRRVLVFPKGSNVDHLSVYLEVADSASLPNGWSRYAQVCLSVVNQWGPHRSVRKDALHKFNARESHWGFVLLMPLGGLYSPHGGWLVNDTIIFKVEVAVRKTSKTETGYVGLKNQGTSYINSLLQSLYHIPCFRKAIYSMPTVETDVPSVSISLALQSLFYELQCSDVSVATKELTGSFEGGTCDVQELKKFLYVNLEEKMKGTTLEGTIQKLFGGHHMTCTECINSNKKYSWKESFYDIKLDTKGCRDVYESFDKYVTVERLEGDNKYHSEDRDAQITRYPKPCTDARKGVLFIDFPPVLQLQLKWSEYGNLWNAAKVNDVYEFPLELDLDRESGIYLSPKADRSIRNLFTLHSLGEHGGQSHAFVRPNLSDKWLKFDDERVIEVDMQRELVEQNGVVEDINSSDSMYKLTKFSNAYLLVYIRKCEIGKVICDVDEQDIAEHLRVRLEEQDKENKKEEARLYIIIKVSQNEDLVKQIGKDIYFDLVDHGQVRSFRVLKQLPFYNFKEEFGKLFGIPVQCQRFWLWANRTNGTYRPNRPLTPYEETQSTSEIVPYEVLHDDARIISSSCAICLDAPAEAACIPCGHMAGCMSCLNETKDKGLGCPICRAKIEQVLRIYAV